MADARIGLLLEFMDQAFKGPAWHGPSLAGSLRGVSAEEAMRRPAAGRHNVWELTLHAAYWKYVVRRRLTRDEKVEFDRGPSDWPATPAVVSDATWKADRALLTREHSLLREVVARFPVNQLGRKGWRSRWSNLQHIEGIASHDLYHCGQIQLVKKLTGGQVDR